MRYYLYVKAASFLVWWVWASLQGFTQEAQIACNLTLIAGMAAPIVHFLCAMADDAEEARKALRRAVELDRADRMAARFWHEAS